MTADVRPLDPAHGPTAVALANLQRAAYAVEAQLAQTDAIPQLHETAVQVAASGEQWLGAFAGQDLVGALAYRRAGDAIDIHRLVVDPAAFRRGIATRLLDALDAGCCWTVATTQANAPALALYAKRGFVAVRERDVDGLAIVELERSGPR